MKILVIEDQSELRDVVAETLREESFATDTASDGEEGLYKALNWNYDLIVLDVFIYTLRQKFGKDFIETRRGQGYIVKS